jgi:hypothetical protein
MKDTTTAIAAAAVMVAGLASQSDGWRQEWKLRPALAADQVHFSIQRARWRNSWSHSHDVPLARFRGISPGLLANGGNARFEYVHDAGRLLCEGSFSWGRGSGTYTFAPSQEFVRELQKMGLEAPDDEQLFSMLMSDVTLEFARGVQEALRDVSARRLVELRVHGVTLDYIRDARQAGYLEFTAKDFVELRIHGVRTDFLRALKASGYHLDAREVIELRNHGVSAEFVADLKQAGYGSLAAREITRLKIHGVRPEFLRDAKELGYNFTPQELVEMRNHGVTGTYLKKLRDAGMKNLTAAQITKLRIHGVE